MLKKLYARLNSRERSARRCTYHVTQGDRANSLKNWKTAVFHYEKALALNSTLVPIWVQLGHAFRELHDYTRAGRAYEKALAIQPQDPDAEMFLRLTRQKLHVDRPDPAVPAKFSAYSLSPFPLVSIIVTNFNGKHHLKDLFDSLDAQTYRNFEAIFVDDGSHDGSADYAESRGAKVIRNSKQFGFAASNNLGQQLSRGELIALINNDMKADPNWLDAMVAAMRNNRGAAAVAPLIRFWTRFHEVKLTSTHAFSISRRMLLDSLDYKKFFLRCGTENSESLSSELSSGINSIVIDVPLQRGEYRFSVWAEAESKITLEMGFYTQSFPLIANEYSPVSVSICATSQANNYFVVNNAGSEWVHGDGVGDRGYGERDLGQFNGATNVDFFCGGSVLIRRDALLGKKLFIGEFKAYFEDTELSRRLINDGFKIYYEPMAQVYHRHSATNVEKSSFWRRYTFRNGFLFRYLAASQEKRPDLVEKFLSHLNHLRNWYKSEDGLSAEELGFFESLDEVRSETLELVSKIDSGNHIETTGLRIGVYNPYWSTKGGGEAHALSVAKVFSEYGDVELISTSDFDVLGTLDYFGIADFGVRKRLITALTTQITAEYDVFVNSCYQNETPSASSSSFYIVSFPSRSPGDEFKKSYYFLANSEYTHGWMKAYWGAETFRSSTVYPLVPEDFFLTEDKIHEKDELILSVGRFATSGHTKNQLEIAEAFVALVDSDPIAYSDWKLALVGTPNDPNYVAAVKAVAKGYNVDVVTGASFKTIADLYKRASIYVHASGLDKDQKCEPELFEHFGIAVAQALASGCIPIVFDAAGPVEILDHAKVGFKFHCSDELRLRLQEVTKLSGSESSKIRIKSIQSAQLYSSAAQRDGIKAIVESSPDRLISIQSREVLTDVRG